MQNFGFIQSIIDGSEKIFEESKSLQLPNEYSYLGNLSPILDQGQYPICVTCSVSAYLNWKEGVKNGDYKDCDIKLFDIYNSRTNMGDGMTFKDAFKYLRHNGVKSKVGMLKIGSYALIRGINALKTAIVTNGPCVAALPVYGNDFIRHPEFWKPSNGIFQGGHAISIVGYNDEGFIIRNSWGKIFGKEGYVVLKYEDFGQFMEIWTIL